ncbi:hypothetical protein [Burkholderia thailandensis]|uniref:hypothetical protein n=1 Tax=Burkholderia thailandensis TaxID=57975 RepID=UPI0039B47446
MFDQTIRLTIGNIQVWDLDRARTEAARLKTLVDDGEDPREIRVTCPLQTGPAGV